LNPLWLSALTSTVPALMVPPFRLAATVEVSLVLPVEEFPANRPPLPAVLWAKFVSSPLAATPSVPVMVVVEPAAIWARVVTPDVVEATFFPTANKPPIATPVAYALWEVVLSASMVTSVVVTAGWAVRLWAPPRVAFPERVMEPGVVVVEGVILWMVAPLGM